MGQDEHATGLDERDADRFMVARIREGDQAAWRRLIDRFEGRLFAFAKARIARHADAEDLVQDAFIGFAQSLDHYDESRDLETYLFRIVRNKIYDLLRSRKIQPIGPGPGDDEDDWLERLLPGDSETPSGLAQRAEVEAARERALGDVLRRLIYEYRDRRAFEDLEAIELLFFGGRRNQEVAELLAIDQKAVAGIKFRAIQKLQKFLGESAEAAEAACSDEDMELSVSNVWRVQRLTCLKRSTLGQHLLGVLEDPWLGYTQFHLDVVGCSMCLANLEDLSREEADEGGAGNSESIFASSIGFLKPSR